MERDICEWSVFMFAVLKLFIHYFNKKKGAREAHVTAAEMNKGKYGSRIFVEYLVM